jgi:predicted nucleotidyltransferase
MMDLQGMQLRAHHQAFVERFVKACLADQRVLAAFLAGSVAKGYADAYSDLDLGIITTEDAFKEFFEARESFLRSLGELVFLEDFGLPGIAFYIFADDTEGELYFGNESRLEQILNGPFIVLVDKKNLLERAAFSERAPDLSEQIEKLRGEIQGFWHEVSHFATAMGRGQLWWAQGQLEALRSICVNLARLRHNILDDEAGEEPYFKVERVMPVDQLSALRETFGPMEKEAIFNAALSIIRFYQEIAPPLAHFHEIHYPERLERIMMDRLQRLESPNHGPIIE